MNVFNAVIFYVVHFVYILVLTPIATLADSQSIYDKIPPLDLSNSYGTVVFDILRAADDYYPLGLIENPSTDGKEYFLDDLVTFGKEIRIVFGSKSVSLTPFARNIRLRSRVVNLRHHVHIEYDLQGSKILRKYYERGIGTPTDTRAFDFVPLAEFEYIHGVRDLKDYPEGDEGSEEEEEEKEEQEELEELEELDEKKESKVPKEPKDTTRSETQIKMVSQIDPSLASSTVTQVVRSKFAPHLNPAQYGVSADSDEEDEKPASAPVVMNKAAITTDDTSEDFDRDLDGGLPSSFTVQDGENESPKPISRPPSPTPTPKTVQESAPEPEPARVPTAISVPEPTEATPESSVVSTPISVPEETEKSSEPVKPAEAPKETGVASTPETQAHITKPPSLPIIVVEDSHSHATPTPTQPSSTPPSSTLRPTSSLRPSTSTLLAPAPAPPAPSLKKSEPKVVEVKDATDQDTFQEAIKTPAQALPLPQVAATPKAKSTAPKITGEVNVLDESLSTVSGFKSADRVRGNKADFRCVYFKNEDDLYGKLKFSQHKFTLSEKADAFEVCYSGTQGQGYNVVVSSQFSSVVVDQTYTYSSLGLKPLVRFDAFAGLASYTERRITNGAHQTSTSSFTLTLDNFTPDAGSAFDRVTCGKCTVYRYKDGSEDDSRIQAVSAIKFGANEYKVPTGSKFIMVAKCEPYLSTFYVTIMVKELFQYQSVVFHSADNKSYREWKYLDDNERLDLLNMFSKVWHHRESNGQMGSFTDPSENDVEVLCLNQFTKKAQHARQSCKSIDNLSNFKLLYHGDDFTNVVFLKRASKSSVIMGNSIFDLTKDNSHDKYIYISHPPNEPASVLVVNSEGETHSLTERGHGSNSFVPITNSFNRLPAKVTKKDVNFGLYKSNMQGITWDFNDYLKKHYLFASKFPEFCLGDLTFHNIRITSHKEEGYKQITTNDRSKLSGVTVTIMLPSEKMVLEVTTDANKNTKVELKSPPISPPRRDYL